MPSSERHRPIDEIVETLDRAERFDDVRSEYEEAIRLRWRRLPDVLPMGLAIGLILGAGRAWARTDLTAAAICAIASLAALVFGGARIARFFRLDRAVSRWKGVADARAAAGKR